MYEGTEKGCMTICSINDWWICRLVLESCNLFQLWLWKNCDFQNNWQNSKQSFSWRREWDPNFNFWTETRVPRTLAFLESERKWKKVKVKSLSHVRLFATPWTVAYHTSLESPWDFPGKSTGVGCHFLPQRIFPTQGSNLGLPHCRQTLYHLSHQGSHWLSWNITINKKDKSDFITFQMYFKDTLCEIYIPKC